LQKVLALTMMAVLLVTLGSTACAVGASDFVVETGDSA
jgi:hypothetical protein